MPSPECPLELTKPLPLPLPPLMPPQGVPDPSCRPSCEGRLPVPTASQASLAAVILFFPLFYPFFKNLKTGGVVVQVEVTLKESLQQVFLKERRGDPETPQPGRAGAGQLGRGGVGRAGRGLSRESRGAASVDGWLWRSADAALLL